MSLNMLFTKPGEGLAHRGNSDVVKREIGHTEVCREAVCYSGGVGGVGDGARVGRGSPGPTRGLPR